MKDGSSFVALAALAWSAAACGGSTSDREPLVALAPPAEAPPTPEANATPEAPHAAMTSRPELQAKVTTAETAPWLPGSGGPGTRRVRISLTNAGTSPSKVAGLQITFRAQRQGVTFPCKPHPTGAMNEPEPVELAPAQSFTYERDLDCAFAALGRYDVTTLARFGAGDAGKDDTLGAFAFDVTGSAPWAPRPLPAHTDVHTALTGSNEVKARPPEAWKRGDHRISLVFVNTAADSVDVGASRLTLAVSVKGGKAVACAREALQSTVEPFKLESGNVRAISVPLKCALAPKTEYDVAAHLAGKDDKGDGPEVGRLHMRVRSEGEPPLTVTEPPLR